MTTIAVTGIGIISPIGSTVDQNLNSLRTGRSGIGRAKHLNSVYAEKLPLGEVPCSNQELKNSLGLHDHRLSRTTLLAFHAFRDAVNDAGLSNSVLAHPRTAFIDANTVGGMCLTDEMHRDANIISEGSPYLLSYDFASITLYIQSHWKMSGPVNTINTACSSSANAILTAARMIRTGRVDRAIAGGCDSLAKFTVNGFNALGILSQDACCPFDKDRKGLNLGEGAGFLVLEKLEDCAGKKIYGVLSGACNTNDAFHPSSLSDDGVGPYLAMEGAIRMADIDPSAIGFINAHGTGTENNDLVESIAMKRLFGQVPGFISTKANTGHTLGAAGAVEAVFSLLNLHHQETFPATRFKHPIPETGLVPVLSGEKKRIDHVLSNSFGFGGSCTSLLFSRADVLHS